MMRSLWSGVSGLQAHQIAMDVEGDNIANVNTSGFKFSRANFANLLSQSAKIATAPQGNLGGKNPMQVGLGTEINSVTRMFSQGSIQTTSKNTDLAIQGNGFFVVSEDNGVTYKYTRSGDFVFDADGNFVNNQGLVAQGWVRDNTTGNIDSTGPIRSIKIDPGLTTPAKATTVVNIKANLNTGDLIEKKSPIRPLDVIGKDNEAGLDGISGTDDDQIKGLLGGKDPEQVDDFGILFNSDGHAFNLKNGQGLDVTFDKGLTRTRFRYTDTPSKAGDANPAEPYNYTYKDADGVVHNQTGQTIYFNTTEDLRFYMQRELQKISSTATIKVNEEGKYELENSDPNGKDLSVQIGGIEDATTDNNILFTRTMSAMSGNLQAGSSGVKISQVLNAATNGASVDIFDSLGTKHTIRTEFRKAGFIYDNNGTKVGSEWKMKVIVPEPGDIGGLARKNIVEGQVIFNADGSLASYTPTSITYTANNGSAPNQTVQLDLGSANKFDGVTSFDSKSDVKGISQDGYTGGDLDGIRIDESGTLVGSFTNGRSFGLAQLAMAKFTNNVGLESDGGNTFVQSANSGEPVIGTAASGGRGFVQSSALEMSNVDLSRSLTQLIVVQRGFQANSKTITTSDQMLNTLLQLKQ